MITRIINTKYSQINTVLKIISSNKFLHDIIKIINPISYQFINNDQSWPKIIKYRDKPKFANSYLSLPEVTIIQEWNMIDNKLLGIIHAYYRNNKLFTAKLECIIRLKDKVYLENKCYWESKSFFIPNNMINNIMDSLDDIIRKIIKIN